MDKQGNIIEAPPLERPVSPVAKGILRPRPLVLDPKEEIVKSEGFTASSPDPRKLCTHFHENSNEFSILHSEMERLDFSKIHPGVARELLPSQLPVFEEGR